MGYVIGFFKAIFIFLGIFVGVYLPGYLLQYVFNLIKLRIIALLILSAVTIKICLDYGDYKAIGFASVYIISIIIFIVQERNLDKGYKKIDFMKDTLNMSWTGLYSYCIPCVLLLRSTYNMTITVSLYIVAAACAFLGSFMIIDSKIKIDKIKAKIDKKSIITFADIMMILQESTKSEDTQEDKDKKLKELLQIIDYFVDTGKIVGIDVDEIAEMVNISDRLTRKIYPIYMTPELNNLIENILNNTLIQKEKISIKELVEKIIPLINTDIKKYEIAESISEEYMYKKSDWIDIDDIYVKESYIDKIIQELEKQCNTYGEYDASKVASIFSISAMSVKDIIDYRGFEYKNLSFVNNVAQNNEAKEANFTHNTDLSIEELKKNDEGEEFDTVLEKIDINSCNDEDLSKVPMFGILNAKKAVKHRDEINGYSNVDEMLEYLSIKPHLTEKIKHHLKCNPIKNNNSNKKIGRRIEI
jgi:hypothetical protein